MESSKLEKLVSETGCNVTSNVKSTVLTIPPDKIREFFLKVRAELPDFYHLTTITGLDEGTTLGIFYHFWKGREFLSIKTSVPKENPVIDSISDLLTGSMFYEGEVKDLLGIIFKGNPLMDRKLILPENYPPQAPPPLRKEADPQKIREMMGLE